MPYQPKVGDVVKVLFKRKYPNQIYGGETMWVEVTGVMAGGYFWGTLRNRPFVLYHVQENRPYKFHSSEIIDVAA